MLELTPDNVTSFPGARIVFSVEQDGNPLLLSSLDATVQVYVPGELPVHATIHESNNTFSWIVPIKEGDYDARALIEWPVGNSEWADFQLRINPVQAAQFTLTTSPNINFTPPVHADIYDPLGQLVHSGEMTLSEGNYSLTHSPGPDWIEGEYRVGVRDTTGLQEIRAIWIERPHLASMKSFFGLPEWQRQVIEYLKYELMGDTDPMHPGALFTLEEYSKHWRSTVQEINDIPPYTDFMPEAIPPHWANVQLKGTTLRVFHALANRGTTVPRWQGLDVPIQDESHLQQAYEQRYNLLRPEYDEERAYMKGHYLPQPAVTVDPFLGWTGGNLAGTSALSLIGRPTWFARGWGIR